MHAEALSLSHLVFGLASCSTISLSFASHSACCSAVSLEDDFGLGVGAVAGGGGAPGWSALGFSPSCILLCLYVASPCSSVTKYLAI